MANRLKILYAIQGTGNGHVSRAAEIIPLLQKKADVDILISGTQSDLALPFKIKYKLRGLSFNFGKKGGIDLVKTFKNSRMNELIRETRKLPVDDYDFILNDFEPVSAWACRFKGVPCIGLSHQAAVMSKKSPKPSGKDILGKFILQHYAPCDQQLGLHFDRYDDKIFTPVIRKRIRNSTPEKKGHFTVYLPAYGEKKITEVLGKLKEIQWQVFSKHHSSPKKVKNMVFHPIDEASFSESLINADGILCGAGFETPAEAIFLNKKLMVIPMKGQYEQQCNAAALKKLNVPAIKKLSLKNANKIRDWALNPKNYKIKYRYNTEEIISEVFNVASELMRKKRPEKQLHVISHTNKSSIRIQSE